MRRPACGVLLALFACGEAVEGDPHDVASVSRGSAASRLGHRRAPLSVGGDQQPGGSAPRDASIPDAEAASETGPQDEPAVDGDGGTDDDAGGGSPIPRFVDVTEAAGLVYEHAPPHIDDPLTDDWYDMEGIVGSSSYFPGGAAATDFDSDGDVDLYVTRLHEPGILFRNRGDGTFEDVTAAAGLALSGFPTVGPVWGDIDNDGDPDLFVTTLRIGRYLLFVNNGDGTFTEEAIIRGAALPNGMTPTFGFSASFGDFDRDGWLDLHTTDWQHDLDVVPTSTRARLLRNRGSEGASLAGHFVDVTVAAGVDMFDPTRGSLSLISSFSDLDDDGWPDLAVVSDLNTSRLFWNDGDGTFTDGTTKAEVGTDGSGMGSAIGDYDGDGRLDWFVASVDCNAVTSCAFDGNRLYRNRGDRTFADDTDRAGVRDGSWGWAASFFEIDNDGDLDLIMTNGSRVSWQDGLPWWFDPVRLWQNDGTGGMRGAARSYDLVDDGDGRGLLVFDFDADGDEDVFIVNHVAGGRLWENRVADVLGAGWLRLRLVGATANRSAYGARVRVERRQGDAVLVRELLGGNNYIGQNEPIVHLGLGPGSDPVYRVEVTWPTPGTRKVQVLYDVAPNQVIELHEPE